jgi:hypothetical protein
VIHLQQKTKAIRLWDKRCGVRSFADREEVVDFRLFGQNLIKMYFYYYWLVPSILSFLASSIVLFDVLYLSKKYTQKNLTYMEWRTVAFAITDLIQTSTWFLGNRRDHQENLCRVQEYSFEAATLSKVFLCIVSSGILSFAVSARKLPNWRVIKGCEYGLMALLVCLMALLIYFDGSRPLCEMSFADDLQETSRIVFLLAYMLPLQLSFFLTIIMTIPPLMLHREVAKTVLKSILDRLVSLPLIFTFCFLPPLILSIIVVTTDGDSLVLYRISAICVSLSGTIFAFFHFYLRGKSPSRTPSTFANSVSGGAYGSDAFGPMASTSEQEMLSSRNTSRYDDSEFFGGD